MSNNIFEFLPETPSGKVLNILEGVDDFITKLNIQYPRGKTPFLHFRKYLIQNIELLNKNREKNKLLPLKFSQLNDDVNYNRQLNLVKLAIEKDINQQQNDVIKDSMEHMAMGVPPSTARILSRMPIAPPTGQRNLPKSKTSNIMPLTEEQVTNFTNIPSLSEEEKRKREQELDKMLLREFGNDLKGGRKKKRQSAKKNKKDKKQSKKSKNTLKRKLKNNKSKRKYKKKGAGISSSRIRRERQTTPPPPPPAPPPRGIILSDLPVAEAIIENPSIATITTNVINSDIPVLNTYSEDRILTVNRIMVEYGFNRLEEELKKEVRLALLNYVPHENFVPLYVERPDRIEDKEERQNRRIIVPGELRILVSEWEEWSVWENVNQNDAIRDLINTLTSPEDTYIMYEYGAEP